MPKFFPVMVLIFSALISACASQKLANSDELQSRALADAAAIDIAPEELIRRASERLNNAEQDLRFYSPLHMQKAQEQLETARKLQQSGKAENKTGVLAAAILAEKLVKQAEDNREQVKQQLAPALSHLAILIELGAKELLPGEFNEAMSDLTDLIILVEGGQLDAVAKEQPSLLEEFAKVEAATLKVKWLNRAIAKLEEAEDLDADKFAPKSFEQARLAIERADSYTNNNYRDREGVKSKADEAFVLASKAVNISSQVQKVFEKKISDLESYMLDVQSWLSHINQEAAVKDLEAFSFYEQSRLITSRLAELSDTKTAQVVSSSEPVVTEASEEKNPENYQEPILSVKPIAVNNDNSEEPMELETMSQEEEPDLQLEETEGELEAPTMEEKQADVSEDVNQQAPSL